MLNDLRHNHFLLVEEYRGLEQFLGVTPADRIRQDSDGHWYKIPKP
jgi:hypothetical protein